MATIKYSDILTDILNRKHSKCICPVEYLAGLKEREPKQPQKAECHFGPNCNFSTTCHFEPAKCTCQVQCTCGLEIPPSLPTIQPVDRGGCCSPREKDLEKPRLLRTDSFTSKQFLRASLDCDKTVCTCVGCICWPQKSQQGLLPSCFQNVIKTQVHSKVCDDLMKQEFEEIKQIIKQHKESEVKPETNIERPHFEKQEKEVKMESDSATKINDLTKFSKTESELKLLGKSRKTSLQNSRGSSEKEPAKECPRKSGPDVKSHVSKKDTKSRRTKMPRKLDPTRTKAMAARTNYYCGCKDYSKRRPPRIRYYYGGGTESYGSKVGHKNCVLPPVSVPKHMGWLWNKEDPSAGIRERKGWPPGFIAKNIKHMMKVMKSFEAEVEPIKEEEGSSPKWKSVEVTEELAPKVDEPPLLHIHKKGRTYNITFCPKESDDDISPIPIPFSITEKKQEGDSSTTDSSLEFELHSPKPTGKYPKMVKKIVSTPKPTNPSQSTEEPAASSTKQSKKKRGPPKKQRSEVSEDKINWEEQTTQMQNIT